MKPGGSTADAGDLTPDGVRPIVSFTVRIFFNVVGVGINKRVRTGLDLII